MIRALADAAVDFVLGFVKVTLDVLVRRFVNNLGGARGLSSALVRSDTHAHAHAQAHAHAHTYTRPLERSRQVSSP